jgi:TRAP transporter 4TM/12TM fusion protein
MGAAAFVIAEYTSNSYWDIAVSAFVPSVIYFTIMFLVVGILSKKDKIMGLPKNQLPNLKQSLKKAAPIAIPIVILVIMLAFQMSVQITILITLATLIVICIPIKDQRIGIVKIFKALSNTAKILIPIATSCSVAGLIVGVMSLTGFGERLSYGIITFAHGSLFLGLIITAIVCLILGMGLPTLGAYVVLATLGAPALMQLGATLLAAHMFIFYFAIISAITPPVCLSAYVGASIAGANPLKVGFTSMFLAPTIYVIPFLFVYNPGLLLQGTPGVIIYAILKALVILIIITMLFQRFLFTKLKIYEFLALLTALGIYIWKHNFPVMAAILIVVFITQLIKSEKLKKIKSKRGIK